MLKENFIDRFLHFFTANLGAKIISCIIAVVLWTVVLGSRTVEITKEVPLEIITPSEVTTANEVPDHIAFQLSGPKAFLRAIMDRREEPIRVNLAGVKPGLVTYRFFPENIHVPIGVKVLSIHPTAIVVKLEPIRRKEVPVQIDIRGKPPEGYRIVKTEVRPPQVRIKGAETRVDAVSEILTKSIDVSDLKQKFEKEVVFEFTQHDIQIEGPAPRVVIDIQPTSANYRVKNVDVRVLSMHHFTLSEKNVTVFIRADSAHIKALDRSQVYAVVDLRGKPKGNYTEPVKVTLPEHLGLVKVVPEKVNIRLH